MLRSAFAVARLAPKVATTGPLSYLSRFYGASAGLSEGEVSDRIMSVIKNFEKVDQGAVSGTSHFVKDLGLDSLDVVEVVVAFEDEFGIEIPDADADAIQSVPDAVQYILKHPSAK